MGAGTVGEAVAADNQRALDGWRWRVGGNWLATVRDGPGWAPPHCSGAPPPRRIEGDNDQGKHKHKAKAIPPEDPGGKHGKDDSDKDDKTK